MAVSSIPNTEQAQGRRARANALFTERVNEFRYEQGVWYAPSATVEGRTYAVKLKPQEVCECASFEYRGGPCKHILATKYIKARTGVCSCCGERVSWRFLTEVMPEHDLLCWFEGDRLCGDCTHAGYWS